MAAVTKPSSGELQRLEPQTAEVLPHDADAAEIGRCHQLARSSIVESVRYQIECGQRLAAKKQSLEHGEWLPWLDQQRDVLGFQRAAEHRLIKLAGSNGSSTINLEPQEALKLSRQIWGNSTHRTDYSGENEWSTPAKYIELARLVLGEIDLDPELAIEHRQDQGLLQSFAR